MIRKGHRLFGGDAAWGHRVEETDWAEGQVLGCVEKPVWKGQVVYGSVVEAGVPAARKQLALN
jgi:hypothetical protein